MKKIRRVIIIFCLILFYCYFINISNFPSKILVYNTDKLNFKLCPFLKLNGAIQTSSNGKSSSYNLKLALGDIELKNIELKRAEKIKVIPCRRSSRLKDFYKRCCNCWLFRN